MGSVSRLEKELEKLEKLHEVTEDGEIKFKHEQ
jgi:hypothetical protein